MFIIYDIFFLLYAILYIPLMVVRGKWHADFKFRVTGPSSERLAKIQARSCIWVHAVSVGEVLAITGLIDRLKSAHPDHPIVCSAVTKTGYQLANEKLSTHCTVIYAPLDFSWVVRKFITVLKPKIYIAAETEIWPNLYMALHKNRVPIIQVNGRISDKGFKGYRKVKWLIRSVLTCVNTFCMQSDLDAERIVRLGADPSRVHVVGNLKFDIGSDDNTISKADLGFKNDHDLLIAGSTHPGEEEILIDLYAQLVKKFDRLRLVIAPRHIERADAAAEAIKQKGFHPVRFSNINTSETGAKTIIVVDTIGQLRGLYNLAMIVFMGKTFMVGGGQNMIEPAFFGKPVIVGPLTQNFKDVVKIFLEADALIQVESPEQMMLKVSELMTDRSYMQTIADNAKATVLKYQGATEKTLQKISDLL